MNLNEGVLIASITVALTACGTSDIDTGGSGDDIFSSVNESPLQITHDNSRDIATRGVSQSQSLDKDTNPTELLSSDSRTSLAAKTLKSAYLKSDGFSMRKTESNSLDCEVSGSQKISFNDVNNNGEPDSGDSMTMDYNKCVDGYSGDTSSTDGKIEIRFNKVASDFNELDVDVDIDALTMSSDDEKSVIDGDISLSVATNNNVTAISVEGNTLRFSINSDVGIMNNFEFAISTNESTSAWTQLQNAVYAGTDINGKIVVETLVTMQGVGSANPTIGKVKISGANSSYMIIDADSGDANTLILTTFDGSSSVSEELNWNELE